MLVVPQLLPGVDVLVDTAYEPVTVVSTDPPHSHGAVVLALAHRTTDETIGAAFDAADQRGAPNGSARAIRPSSSSVPRATPGSSWSGAPSGVGSSGR